jgi:hypothetical protein
MNTITAGQRCVSPSDIELIRTLLRDHPEWNRRRLSRELCDLWGWQDAKGRMRDMACRQLLLKLHRGGEITLPQAQRPCNNDHRRWSPPEVAVDTEPLSGDLRELLPLSLVTADGDPRRRRLVRHLLHHHHYLGYRGSPGESLWYLIHDCRGRMVACLTFGAAAWTLKPRDAWIGWDAATRARNLQRIVNNQRFLIPPWVHVQNLASHVLSLVSRRLSRDWHEKYGHPVYLLETFVDSPRFSGTCYRAANWEHLGQTTGRTRNGRGQVPHSPVKAIYAYPLSRDFRRKLCGGNS